MVNLFWDVNFGNVSHIFDASGRLVDSAQEHVEMCDLIAAGDTKKLKKLMSTHLGHTRREWAGRSPE